MVFFLTLFLFITCYCNKPIPSGKIIIDTDCAIDDFHAINFLLSRPEVKIKAVIVSEGTLNVTDGVARIKSLLKEWNAGSIPVLYNTDSAAIIPSWRDFNRKLSWGRSPDNSPGDNFSLALKSLFEDDGLKSISLVCLGSLATANDILDHYPEYLNKINRIVWYVHSINPVTGFNYDCNQKAADKILESNKIRIDMISNLDPATGIYTNWQHNLSKETDNRLSRIIYDFHQQLLSGKNDYDKHNQLKDELVAVYILNPELFDMDVNPSDIWIRYNESYDLSAIKEVIDDLLDGNYRHSDNIVFNEFPSERTQYNYDVRQIMDSAISLYGNEEWKACVMTDEFHGHLGVYSIVGAKMGIKAREMFNVGPDILKVVSFAGTTPPYSCLSDGIQVSTGATLGQGLISIAADSVRRPEAIFTFRGKSIKIKLKDEYLKKVNDDIREGVVKYGLMDDGYWKLVRRSALRYWVDWDRNKIFEISTD